MDTPGVKRILLVSKVQDLERSRSRGEVSNRLNKEVNKVWVVL